MTRTIKTTTDPYGVIEMRRESIDLLTASAAEIAEFNQSNDADWIAGLILALERDIKEFWLSEGLPGDVGPYTIQNADGSISRSFGAKPHPSMVAEPETWLGMSWGMWTLVQHMKQALADGKLHLAVKLAFLLGQKQGEIKIARRHGPHASQGRRSSNGIPKSRESLRQNLKEKFADRDAEIRRLDDKLAVAHPHLRSKGARAERIKEGFTYPNEHGRLVHIDGLDRWLNVHNAEREVVGLQKLPLISSDAISRMIPERK